MTNNNSLYGSTPSSQGNVSSANLTTLYSGNAVTVPANGNLVIPGTLTVNGCAILTDCSAFSLLPTTATSILFGNAATTMSIGANTGTTTINNQLATANYTFPIADGANGQVIVTDGAGTLSFAAVTTVGKTYNIDASTTTGGANLNLTSDIPTTDTVKFASGSGITVSRTDANTITITNSDPGSAGVTSITGTANQVIASASTGAVTLSTPQDIATTSTPTFAGANLGNVTVGVATDQTISTSTGDLLLTTAAGNNMYLTTDQTNPIFAVRNTTNTNAVARALTLKAHSTGTPVLGFGTRLEYQVETATGVTKQAGFNDVYSTDVTTGSEDFSWRVGLMNNGAVAATRLELNSFGQLNLFRNTPDTNTSTSSFTINANSTGTTAAGFGTAIGFNIEKADGNLGNAGYIDMVNTDSTIGSEDYRMGFGLMQNGTTGYRMLLASTALLTLNNGGGLKINGLTNGSSQFTAPATGSTLTYVLPGSAGAANTVLTNDGSGNLSWALPGGGGSTFGNITVGIDTDNTISTTTGDLVLDSASGTIALNVPIITTDATTISVFPTTATTINVGGGASTVNVSKLDVDGRASLDTNLAVTTSTATFALATSTRNAMNVLVNITQGSNVHCVNATVLRVDATTAMLTTYGEMYNNIVLANFTADVNSGLLRLLATATSTTSTTFNAVRTSLN